MRMFFKWLWSNLVQLCLSACQKQNMLQLANYNEGAFTDLLGDLFVISLAWKILQWSRSRQGCIFCVKFPKKPLHPFVAACVCGVFFVARDSAVSLVMPGYHSLLETSCYGSLTEAMLVPIFLTPFSVRLCGANPYSLWYNCFLGCLLEPARAHLVTQPELESFVTVEKYQPDFSLCRSIVFWVFSSWSSG